MPAKDLNPAARQRRLIIRTGIFVAFGLVLAGVVVFLIGRERDAFSSSVTYRGAFENVDGLQVESPVRLGGLTVGRVKKVGFSPDLEDQRILVTMEITSRFKERIRKDSIARVTSRGVLGDKAIDISMGSPQFELIENGGEIKTGVSGDLSALLKASGEIVDNATAITKDLRAGVAAFTAPAVQNDVTAFIKSARNVAQEVEQGQGTLHTLIYDKRTSDEVKQLVSRASDVATKLDSAVVRVDAILAEVQKGDGTLHALVYDKQLASAVAQLGKAADEVGVLIHDARTSKTGAVYQLVYGDASSMLGDLGKAAADIKDLTAKVKRGEGSLGGVINDPTVYEDLKEVLGNVKRNRVLRELVRLSVSKESEIERAGKPQK